MFCHCAVVFCNVNLQYLLYCIPSRDEAAVKAAAGWRIQLEGDSHRREVPLPLPGNRKKLCKALHQPFVFSCGPTVSSHTSWVKMLLRPCAIRDILHLLRSYGHFQRQWVSSYSSCYWILILSMANVCWDCVEIFLHFKTNWLYMVLFFLYAQPRPRIGHNVFLLSSKCYLMSS